MFPPITDTMTMQLVFRGGLPLSVAVTVKLYFAWDLLFRTLPVVIWPVVAFIWNASPLFPLSMEYPSLALEPSSLSTAKTVTTLTPGDKFSFTLDL